MQKLADLNYSYKESLRWHFLFTLALCSLYLLPVSSCWTFFPQNPIQKNCNLKSYLIIVNYKTFKICCVKLLLWILAFLFKWGLQQFRWLALIILQWSMRKKFFFYIFLSNYCWFCSPFYLFQFNNEQLNQEWFSCDFIWWCVWIQIICPGIKYKIICFHSNWRFYIISHTSCSWEGSHQNFTFWF